MDAIKLWLSRVWWCVIINCIVLGAKAYSRYIVANWI